MMPTPSASRFRTFRSVALSLLGRPSFTPWATAHYLSQTQHSPRRAQLIVGHLLEWRLQCLIPYRSLSTRLYNNSKSSMSRSTGCSTLVGQEILRGKHISEGGVTPRDWLHFIISLLCHDIGYVRGVCRGDGNGQY